MPVTVRSLLLLFLLAFFANTGHSQQYQLNGNASANSCNCYTLTNDATFQSGSAWNRTLFDLNNPFDFRFSVNLGCKDATGADGIVFMLQQQSTSLGASGGGMGFDGVQPSVGILLDTWQNLENNDPVFDHISIQANGVLSHGTDLAGPVRASASSDNIEDCAWHILRITWDPVTQWLRAYFDGSMRVEAQVNLIGTIFNNNPNVFWGFTAATGGSSNRQQFCTALAPAFQTSLTANAGCLGDVVSFVNTSESFAPIIAYHWDFGDGTTSSLPNPPPKLYTQPGNYEVKLALKGFDGCDSDTLRTTVSIGDFPVAAFDVFDTCSGAIPRIVDRSSVAVGGINNWQWYLNGNAISQAQQPQLSGLAPGNYVLELEVESANGCGSQRVAKTFTVRPSPVIDATVDNGCINLPVQHQASQIDNATQIVQWDWRLGDGTRTNQPDFSYAYSATGNYSAAVVAVASNGCVSNTVTLPFNINQAEAFAGNDTVFIKDEPFQLNASGGGSYLWSPSTGLNDPTLPNPTGVLQDDIVYTVTVTTPEGCTASDDIAITIFKESRVYVPSGFTPNGDGKNDTFLPYLIGIRSLDYFQVYNRWGQLVFQTRSSGQGWDGRFGGSQQPSGVYVWRLRAVDYAGKVYELKGSITLIR
jgi:gliding motility-associated-like protein